eukprot:TRINITY_DN31496_c0_g1_i1.p1 TRINITY_DN31496_c0_g1~~TRINITY_DN31496_c0_g1_i1.p1  ORF type:complete len:301 (+),score=52.83 TRINITY_DN31496_c0_g1_i1:59-904(+)
MASSGAIISESRQFIVMANGTADFRTITDALKECQDGDTITVKIGQYDEKVVVDKNVTIEGDADSETSDIIVNGGIVTKTGGTIKNISVSNQIEIRSGNITIEGCDISEGFDGIKIAKDANPTIIHNTIHHARQGGDCIYVAEGARATIEENDIHDARVNGIHVNKADVVIRKNRVHNCHFGIFLRKRSKGIIEGNTIQDCATFGIYLVQGADPVVERNNISGCNIHAIMISQDGMGTLRDNMCNGSLTVKKGSVPQMENNQILGKVDNENVMASHGSFMG